MHYSPGTFSNTRIPGKSNDADNDVNVAKGLGLSIFHSLKDIPNAELFEAYISSGSVTEILHSFIAEYDESLKKSDGGGVAAEQEEIDFQRTLTMIG